MFNSGNNLNLTPSGANEAILNLSCNYDLLANVGPNKAYNMQRRFLQCLLLFFLEDEQYYDFNCVNYYTLKQHYGNVSLTITLTVNP